MDIVVADADEETRLTLVEAIAAVAPASRIVEVSDGGALQAVLSAGAPDVVFVDTILPGTDAAEIMAWRTARGARSVVVLVTDLLAARWPHIAKRIEAYDVILKPLGRDSVERVLRAAPVLRSGLRLLLAEPSVRLRYLTRLVLEQSLFDFDVVEVIDGAGAVRTAREQGFDVVLIGNSLPDMPALEVACRIDALRPDARVLLIGGDGDALTPAQLALFGARGFLRRPFSAADIDRAVYDALDLWQPYLVKALREEERAYAASTPRRAPAAPV